MDATKYGFPFPEMKCHSTFVKKEFKEEPIEHLHSNGSLIVTEYNKEKSPYSTLGRGFINNYDGEGYQKTVALDMSNPDYFKDTYL